MSEPLSLRESCTPQQITEGYTTDHLCAMFNDIWFIYTFIFPSLFTFFLLAKNVKVWSCTLHRSVFNHCTNHCTFRCALIIERCLKLHIVNINTCLNNTMPKNNASKMEMQLNHHVNELIKWAYHKFAISANKKLFTSITIIFNDEYFYLAISPLFPHPLSSLCF